MISIKWLRYILLLILVSVITEKSCFAVGFNRFFKGTWENGDDSVEINKCKSKTCSVQVMTYNGLFICELDSDSFTALSENEGLFYITSGDSKKNYPIKLHLAKQKLSIIIPDESRLAARESCGANASFDEDERFTKKGSIKLYATSFDCEKASTTIEKTICQSSEIANADFYLATIYNRLKNDHVKNIVEQQRAWIKERNSCASSSSLNQCLLEKYLSRVSILQIQVLQHFYNYKQTDNITSYNFTYLINLAQFSYSSLVAVFQDPLLQHYLKKVLPEDIFNTMLPMAFYTIQLEHLDNTSMIFEGGYPGLYGLSGALFIARDQFWLAHISKDTNSVVVMNSRNAKLTEMPKAFKKRVKWLLKSVENKQLVVIKVKLND